MNFPEKYSIRARVWSCIWSTTNANGYLSINVFPQPNMNDANNDVGPTEFRLVIK